MSQVWSFLLSLPPVVAAIFSALIGAFAAQMLSHWLTNQREKEKYNREVYQKLYSDTYFDALYYFDVRAQDNQVSSSYEPATVFEKFVTHLQNNLKYASPRLIAAYRELKRREYAEHYWAPNNDERDRNELLRVFSNELYQFARADKSGIFDQNLLMEVNRYRYYYLLWQIIYEATEYNEPKTRLVMRLRPFLNDKYLNDKNYNKLKSLNNLLSFERDQMYEEFIKYIADELIMYRDQYSRKEDFLRIYRDVYRMSHEEVMYKLIPRR